ncbi:ImuA family protein [Methylobacterium sp. J-090]|uniref:ImuA family protein n=1 Tax=Methylobacterium sp. J-090 TaxID=2836666 RepID=UPI001FB87101|nr:ImuA protein [Methylobacterium sp. J-090]MCJ2080426.1 ImuA protein [Methylobacterium sp. J-090]
MTPSPPARRPDAAPRECGDASSRLAALRTRIAIHDSQTTSRKTLSFGVHAVDGGLPGGGLGLGHLHEVAPEAEGDEPAALGFALALVARRLAEVAGDALLVIARGHPMPYGHGLAGLGLDPGRLLLFEAGSDSDAYRALEEALRTGGLAAVAGLVDAGLPLTQSRRLHLARGRTDGLLLVLRPAGAESPNVAATRWRIAAGKALRDRFGCIERPCWRVRLDRCRNGRTGDWLLEWDHAAHRFGLAGALAGHPPQAGGAGSLGGRP